MDVCFLWLLKAELQNNGIVIEGVFKRNISHSIH